MKKIYYLSQHPPAATANEPSVAAPTQESASKNVEDSTTDGQTPATIWVRLPAGDAVLWLEGSRTKKEGQERLFQTPPLEPGQDYDYQLRARWLQDKRLVDETRRAKVRAGERTEVDFTRPEPAAASGPLSAAP